MKIGHVTATYLPVVNGVTMMVSQYKKYLEALGHQVTIFTLGDREENDFDHGILRSPGFSLPNTGYCLALRYSKIAQEYLADVDIIHCHHPVMGLEFCHRYSKAPVVFTLHTRHDIYASEYIKIPKEVSRSLMYHVLPRMMKACGGIIAPSASIAIYFQQFVPGKKIEIVNNGIEVEKFQVDVQPRSRSDMGVPEDCTLLIYTGRLAGEKNLEKLLSEFKIAKEADSTIQLMLVGGGPAKKKLENYAERLNLTDHINFAGFVPNYELPSYLMMADLFITTSLSDTLPLTVIEAMAAGLPVVAIKAPGIIDLVVDGLTGLLASSSEGDLANKILYLKATPEARLMMSKRASIRSRQFHFRKTAQQTLDLYFKLRSGKQPTDDCWQDEVGSTDPLASISRTRTNDQSIEENS